MIKIENVEVMGFEAAIRGMRNPKNSWDRSDSGICKGGDNGIGCENCAHCGCDHAYDNSWKLGKNDHELMMKLAAGGPVHAKYRRMITVYVDITAPLYWWKEFDTYKVGTVANSCSTMHKIADKEFTLEDFSCERLIQGVDDGGYIESSFDVEDPDNEEHSIVYTDVNTPFNILELVVETLNKNRELYLKTKDKKYWWQMIQLLPSSYNQKRTVMLNYEVLAHIYQDRKNHKLDEWREHDFSDIKCSDYHGYGFCNWIKTLPYSELITGYPETVTLYAIMNQ